MKLRLLLFFTVVAILSMTGISYATEYKEYPLAPPGADIRLYINNNGEVVACYYLPNNICRYFVYNPITQVCSNSIDVQKNGFACGINDRGQVVMRLVLTNAVGEHYSQGAIWDSTNGELTMLPLNCDAPFAINNSGHVVGRLYPPRSLFFWDASGEMEDLGFEGDPQAINDNDQIVGDYWINNTEGYSSFIWSKETGMVDMGHYGYYSKAQCINNRGQVAGYVMAENGEKGVFLWDSTNGYRTIYSVREPQPSDAYVSINDNGTVAFYWSGNAFYTWDEANGVQYHEAELVCDINNAGMIAGMRTDGRAVLWVPVPEPSSMLALGAGLLGAGALLRRRMRN